MSAENETTALAAQREHATTVIEQQRFQIGRAMALVRIVDFALTDRHSTEQTTLQIAYDILDAAYDRLEPDEKLFNPEEERKD